MKFLLPLSLERSALTALAAQLWSTQVFARNTSIDQSSSHYAQCTKFEYWSRVQKEVEKRAHTLLLPENLKKDLLRFVGAAGYEISRWYVFHIRQCEIKVNIPKTFIWTALGTINRYSTAEMLVHDDRVDVLNRFKLACVYCIKKFIFILWDQLDAESLRKIKSETWVGDVDFLVKFWCRYLETQELNSQQGSRIAFSETLFVQSLYFGSIAAVSVIFPRTIESNRTVLCLSIIDSFLKHIDIRSHMRQPRYTRQYTHVLCLVLNQLDETQQAEIMNKWPRAVLCLFLEWPWQAYFIKLYEYSGPFLTDEQFYDLLKRLLVKQVLGFNDYDYKGLFVQVWQQASIEHKQFILNSDLRVATILCYLHKLEDLHVLTMVLNDVSAEQKMMLLSDSDICHSVKKTMLSGDWNSVECFVTYCLLSDEEITKFKNSMCSLFPSDISTAAFSKMNSLFNARLSASVKRSIEYCHNERKKPHLE